MLTWEPDTPSTAAAVADVASLLLTTCEPTLQNQLLLLLLLELLLPLLELLLLLVLLMM